MAALVEVSSINTSRAGSNMPSAAPCARDAPNSTVSTTRSRKSKEVSASTTPKIENKPYTAVAIALGLGLGLGWLFGRAPN